MFRQSELEALRAAAVATLSSSMVVVTKTRTASNGGWSVETVNSASIPCRLCALTKLTDAQAVLAGAIGNTETLKLYAPFDCSMSAGDDVIVDGSPWKVKQIIVGPGVDIIQTVFEVTR
jgi:hypothetical protein